MVYLALKIDAGLNQLLLLGTSYIFVMGADNRAADWRHDLKIPV
jgi:hypothetical protein